MTTAASGAVAIASVLDRVMREDRGRLLSALIVRLGDMQKAEDALHEALASALTHWGRNGVPASPQGWLLQVAWRKALDGFRNGGVAARAHADLLIRMDEAMEDPEDIPDHRLRLIFTCCHPALEEKTRVALTLRTVCGLTTGDIARVYLDAEPTMGQRLSRAKAKIAGAGIPYQVPDADGWGVRLNSVLTVIYLIFTAGYTAGPVGGRDLCEEAVFLARLVNDLHPQDAEIEGALALLLITHARRAARVNAHGATVPPAQQDRTLWDVAVLGTGRDWLDRAMARRAPGPFQIKAAVASLMSPVSGAIDWPQIAALYAGLYQWEPTAVVQISQIVAMVEAGTARGDAIQAVTGGLQALAALAPEMDAYQPFHAVRADLLARAKDWNAARASYDRAIALAQHPADVRFLADRRADLPD